MNRGGALERAGYGSSGAPSHLYTFPKLDIIDAIRCPGPRHGGEAVGSRVSLEPEFFWRRGTPRHRGRAIDGEGWGLASCIQPLVCSPSPTGPPAKSA